MTRACEATRYHRPRPGKPDRHHVEPAALGGPDTADNLVDVCQTCHASIHALLRLYMRRNGKPPWTTRRRFPRGVQRLAAAGWFRILARRSDVTA